MTQEKFTPGPWAIYYSPIQIEEGRGGYPYPYIGIMHGNNAIAELNVKSKTIPESQMNANANLIASAPLMYAELKKLYDGLASISNAKNCPININNRIIALTDNTKEVISKANGTITK